MRRGGRGAAGHGRLFQLRTLGPAGSVHDQLVAVRQCRAGAFPVTIEAGNGAVTIEKQPAAIVSLSPTATEMLFAIGAGDQLKAADKNSDYPAEAPTPPSIRTSSTPKRSPATDRT